MKDNNDWSGRKRKACQYFEQLGAIFGSRPATELQEVAASFWNGAGNYSGTNESMNYKKGEMVSKDFEPGQNETEQKESEKEQGESKTEHNKQQQVRTDKPPSEKKQRTVRAATEFLR